MVSPSRAVLATFVALTSFALTPALGAEPGSWLVIEAACPLNTAEVARRVDDELIGSRSPTARARVSIEAIDAGYSVRLYAARAGQDLGAKHLVLPNCDEAVDAAVLVLAIALAEPERPADEVVPDANPPPEFQLTAPPGPLARDRVVDAPDERGSNHGSRAGMLLGVETGTVPHPAAYVGASLAVPFGAWEAWSGLRYGLPVEEESVETTTSERVRHDFGAFGVSLCRGAGAAWRFSLCAGGELGVVRLDRTRRDGDVELETDEERALVAGVATARVSGRAGRVRPELEFSAAAASVGPGAVPTLSLRLGAGVLVQF